MSRLNYPWKAWRPPEDNAQIGFAPLQDEIPLTQRSTATSYIELDRLGSFGGTRQRKGQPTVTQLPNHTKGDETPKYAAKAHELMMAFSFGAIVLHRVQASLISSEGIPLGLITAPYRITDAYYLLSKEFWGGATASQSKGPDTRSQTKPFRWVFLALLIAVTVILTALSGPSSAVLMIPQLAWWDVKDPFARGSDMCFLNMSSKDIWPSIVPDPWTTDLGQETAVTAGLNIVANWASAYENQLMRPNISIDCDGGVMRYATSVPQEAIENPGNSTWTAASTVSHRQARDVGSFWEWVSEQALKPKNISRPILKPRLVNTTVAVQKPLVQIECTMHNLTNSTKGIEFPHDQLVPQIHKHYDNVHWPVPRQYLNTGWYNSTIGVYADFIDVRNYSNATSTAAVYIFKDQWTNFQILPCSILAHWVPVSMWLDPRTDNLVYEDSPDPIDALNRSEYHNLSATTQVVIPPSWTSAINNILVYDPPPLAHMAKNFGVHYSVDPPLYVIQGRQKIPWQIATTLGLYVADSLARVNYLQAPNASIVMHDPNNGSIPFVRELDDLNAGNLIFPLGNYMAAYGINEVDPRPYYDTDEVTAFSLEVQRFGYAWSTRSITVKLAATVLLLQATLAIGHLVILLITSWTSNSWRSAGELLALASRRGNTGRLRNVGGGIERINTWKGIVKVRSEGFTGEMVELLVDKDIFDNTMTRLYGDKKYS